MRPSPRPLAVPDDATGGESIAAAAAAAAAAVDVGGRVGGVYPIPRGERLGGRQVGKEERRRRGGALARRDYEVVTPVDDVHELRVPPNPGRRGGGGGLGGDDDADAGTDGRHGRHGERCRQARECPELGIQPLLRRLLR
jgi:hypothetical protein